MFAQRTLLTVALFILAASISSAQFNQGTEGSAPTPMHKEPKLFLSAQVGYSFGALINTYDGQIRLDPGEWFGGALDYAVRRDVLLELSYYYRTSTITSRYGNAWAPGGSENLGNQTTQYFQIGSLKTFRKDRVAPFIGGNLGAGVFSSDVRGSSASWFFTVSGLGGAKIFLTNNIGIRVQGRLMLPIFFGSMGFYCGTGGCGAGVGGSGTVEGELSTGLFVGF